MLSGLPPVEGKKQEGVKEVRGEGRRKNLDRGNLPNLAHPVESRGRQGQAESVGSCKRRGSDERKTFAGPKTFFVSGLLFLSDGVII